VIAVARQQSWLCIPHFDSSDTPLDLFWANALGLREDAVDANPRSAQAPALAQSDRPFNQSTGLSCALWLHLIGTVGRARTSAGTPASGLHSDLAFHPDHAYWKPFGQTLEDPHR